MPITAQCRSCAARYKVVDSAAGRRVKCRRCGKPIILPGGDSSFTEPAMNLRAMAEVERNGRVLATTPEAEFEQYQSNVATLNKPDPAANAKKDYRSIHDLASADTKKKLAAKNNDGTEVVEKASLLSMLLTGIGGLALVAGAGLWIGNFTQLYPITPLAGYITMAVGAAILVVGRKI